jgi:hypothetical protein
MQVALDNVGYNIDTATHPLVCAHDWKHLTWNEATVLDETVDENVNNCAAASKVFA